MCNFRERAKGSDGVCWVLEWALRTFHGRRDVRRPVPVAACTRSVAACTWSDATEWPVNACLDGDATDAAIPTGRVQPDAQPYECNVRIRYARHAARSQSCNGSMDTPAASTGVTIADCSMPASMMMANARPACSPAPRRLALNGRKLLCDSRNNEGTQTPWVVSRCLRSGSGMGC